MVLTTELKMILLVTTIDQNQFACTKTCINKNAWNWCENYYNLFFQIKYKQVAQTRRAWHITKFLPLAHRGWTVLSCSAPSVFLASQLSCPPYCCTIFDGFCSYLTQLLILVRALRLLAMGICGSLSIKLLSDQYWDSHVTDKTVSSTVSSLTWESPHLGKTVFILRRGPVFIF